MPGFLPLCYLDIPCWVFDPGTLGAGLAETEPHSSFLRAMFPYLTGPAAKGLLEGQSPVENLPAQWGRVGWCTLGYLQGEAGLGHELEMRWERVPAMQVVLWKGPLVRPSQNVPVAST